MAILFEKSVIVNENEEGNKYLSSLRTRMSGSPHSPIDPNTLRRFFEQSLQSDNFNGLALLANYVDQYQVDIADWNLNKFRSALDYYLNHSVDLNNLLTFIRFYTKYISDHLNNPAI
jgi:hypothetical protein